MNILDKFGFKEVCDVCLYNIDHTTGDPTNPVLFLDTLKISTIETNCQQTDATGGQGNGVLLSWDYGKDIVVNFSDALFSMKSLSVLNGTAVVESENGIVRQGIEFGGTRVPNTFIGPNGKRHFIPSDRIIYDPEGHVVEEQDLQSDQKYIMCFTLTPRHFYGVPVTARDFPGVYYMVGETIARNLKNNEDEFCQLIIPKIKIYNDFNFELTSSDPTVFSFRGRALSTSEKRMMSLVKYDVDELQGNMLFDNSSVQLYSSLDERLLVRFR